MEIIEEKETLLTRLETVEHKVDVIADKVDQLVEMGSVTAESVQEITEQLSEQKDYYSQMRNAMGNEVTFYRRVFGIGSAILALFLMYIISKL